ADHVKELAKELTDRSAANSAKKPEEPLVFLKAASALIGHRGQTRRPATPSAKIRLNIRPLASR
ncbi:MAG TPA: hypothetical protein PLH39_10115, partial [Promineifilum sp.]|nr:hypothetical protein [Promineifilum sp.]